jgi:hypothetical protein
VWKEGVGLGWGVWSGGCKMVKGRGEEGRRGVFFGYIFCAIYMGLDGGDGFVGV